MKMKKEDLVRGRGLVHKGGDFPSNNNVHQNHNNNNNNINVVGNNKVLPISDSASSSSSSLSSSLSSIRGNVDDPQQCGPSDPKKGKVDGESSNKNKTLARMKELLRWAAAIKSGKASKFGRKGLHFRNRSATIKGGAMDDELNKESPKISLKWEVESCSTTCSVASAPPSFKYDRSAHNTGSWITTDDEFVVLEL